MNTSTLTVAMVAAAANAVRLVKPDYDYETFSASNVQTLWKDDGSTRTATVTFDAPSTHV